MNFDEAIILINACVWGLQKACGDLDFKVTENELNFHCRSLFDMHRLDYDERLDREQFREWAANDPSPKYFMQLFHTSQGLPDIYSEVQSKNNEQGLVFQMLAKGKLTVTATELAFNPHFARALDEPTDAEVEVLIGLMRIGENGDTIDEVTDERYHTVLRTWNIFNVCDLDGSGTLDSKEMEILLWIQLRRKPTKEFVREFVRSIDQNKDGDVSRAEWCEAIVSGVREVMKRHNASPQEAKADLGHEEEMEKARSEDQTSQTRRRMSCAGMGMRAVPSSTKKAGKSSRNPLASHDENMAQVVAAA